MDLPNPLSLGEYRRWVGSGDLPDRWVDWELATIGRRYVRDEITALELERAIDQLVKGDVIPYAVLSSPHYNADRYTCQAQSYADASAVLRDAYGEDA